MGYYANRLKKRLESMTDEQFEKKMQEMEESSNIGPEASEFIKEQENYIKLYEKINQSPKYQEVHKSHTLGDDDCQEIVMKQTLKQVKRKQSPALGKIMNNLTEERLAKTKAEMETLQQAAIDCFGKSGSMCSARVGFIEGGKWDREQMKSYIKRRMEELWEKLPDTDKGTFTNEEAKLLGKYMMLEELDDMLNDGKE